MEFPHEHREECEEGHGDTPLLISKPGEGAWQAGWEPAEAEGLINQSREQADRDAASRQEVGSCRLNATTNVREEAPVTSHFIRWCMVRCARTSSGRVSDGRWSVPVR